MHSPSTTNINHIIIIIIRITIRIRRRFATLTTTSNADNSIAPIVRNTVEAPMCFTKRFPNTNPLSSATFAKRSPTAIANGYWRCHEKAREDMDCIDAVRIFVIIRRGGPLVPCTISDKNATCAWNWAHPMSW